MKLLLNGLTDGEMRTGNCSAHSGVPAKKFGERLTRTIAMNHGTSHGFESLKCNTGTPSSLQEPATNRPLTPSDFSNIDFNIILPSMPRSSKLPLPLSYFLQHCIV
jgi:hypothetical protein